MPFGWRMVTSATGIVLPEIVIVIFWPAVAAKLRTAFCPAVSMTTVVDARRSSPVPVLFGMPNAASCASAALVGELAGRRSPDVDGAGVEHLGHGHAERRHTARPLPLAPRPAAPLAVAGASGNVRSVKVSVVSPGP